MEGEKGENFNLINAFQVKKIAEKHGVGESFIDAGGLENWQGIANKINCFLGFLPKTGNESEDKKNAERLKAVLTLGAILSSKVKNPEGKIEFDFNKFREAGGDPSQVLRAVLLNLSYPEGLTARDERFSLSITPQYLKGVLDIFRNIFPLFERLKPEEVMNILEDWGLKVNPNLGREEGFVGYSLPGAERGKIEEILRNILSVQSYNNLTDAVTLQGSRYHQ